MNIETILYIELFIISLIPITGLFLFFSKKRKQLGKTILIAFGIFLIYYIIKKVLTEYFFY